MVLLYSDFQEIDFLTQNLQVSKDYFPEVAVGYDDSRVKLHIGDGMRL